jgi:hypothetical protein
MGGRKAEEATASIPAAATAAVVLVRLRNVTLIGGEAMGEGGGMLFGVPTLQSMLGGLLLVAALTGD